MNQVIVIFLLFVGVLVAPLSVFAHVTVKPAEVGVGQRVNFAVSVPTEEDSPTVSLRLVIPPGLQSVTPNAKAGWNIEIKRIGVTMKGPILNTGQPAPDPETVTEIVWSGGSIPVGTRDEFIFSAQVPASETELVWKAYQTYADGTVAAWDSDSMMAEENDHSASKPYSITKVVNDLKPVVTQESLVVDEEDNNLPLYLSALAVLLGGLSLGIALRKR